MSNPDIIKILDHIDPSRLDYEEWLHVGMAIKEEGLDCSVWENWSSKDIQRFHRGECSKKWDSFNGSSTPVTIGTIIQYAKDQGWSGSYSHSNVVFDWNDEINAEEILTHSNEGVKLFEPKNWDPAGEIIRYLETLFEASDNVGFVTETWQTSENGKTKYFPTKGTCAYTAGELITELGKHRDDISYVIGDYRRECGAWVRFNPLDGKGVKNENVTDFRYALVESDSMPLESQNAMLRDMELPIAVMVYSGGKSIHAIVHIDAANYEEYRKRVDYLYKFCAKNGLEIDKQNRNPSRLSRMPGVIRGDNKQYIIDTRIGKSSWDEWFDWVESINDDLPDPESLAAEWDSLPDLSPALIDGILRQGHKMLLAGPSKAGKSYALIELCCAIAEGISWLGFPCAKGRVLYVNLELDRPSCLHRFKDVYKALKIPENNIKNIDIWNLRGKSVPMDKLAPKLIRRAASKNYIAIIIDPIYKVITGDENSADQMSHFCNQFDKVCTELGSAVIYCHHHSKGGQGGKKSMDRASGSGVFARDPDALLDLTELELSDSLKKANRDKAACEIYIEWILRFSPNFKNEVSQDDLLSPTALSAHASRLLPSQSLGLIRSAITAAEALSDKRTAWRIEGTLREFAPFKPINLWFDYPIHTVDNSKVLEDLQVENNMPPWKKANKKRTASAKEINFSNNEKFIDAYNVVAVGDAPTMQEIATYLGKPVSTVRDWAKKAGYSIDKASGKVVKSSDTDA